ncbi:NAD-dependent protein deacetylase sirtuin-6-like [Mizuhopecten yessoensis]|uniref:NAD-dependent protein deacetylase sirtuin-6 n=1 Tax=Mizuhopecten yessoensis TaxID=6573 RepID=A0A210PR88_MIZYE|nr:NAD-dependent protein deacetylase sirtuin-6-like [Mizuhopecten yessoensis]OWF39003.1 NAD-dependent protein deacetylase sirtuin-6 [Mizuhopecten yessoensis]
MADAQGRETNAGGYQCHLKACKLGGTVNPSDARAEVRGYTVSATQEFLAKWEADGGAVFHMECWQILSDLANRSKVTNLCSKEKSLVLEAEDTAELHQSMDSLTADATRIARMIKECKYPIAFTGAGISTSAGIGDFRGIHGKWTNRDKEKDHGSQKEGKAKAKRNVMSLRPTYTHEALLKLIEMGYLQYIISQNTDGLHRLSGIPEDKISELHGNGFVEKCEKCNKRYVMNHNHRLGPKDPKVPVKKCEHCRINHRTGRICPDPKCKGYLMNTIINFGDNLEEHVLSSAIHNAEKADMVLTLGSTLKVSPANSLVTMGQTPVKLVICNRQITPYDDVCEKKDPSTKAQLGCRVFGDCDDLMRVVMRQLMDAGQLEEWERGREERCQSYDGRRQN